MIHPSFKAEDLDSYKKIVLDSGVRYLDTNEFKETTVRYNNLGGVGIFSAVDRRSLEPTIFVDKDCLETLVSTTDGQNFQDILPFMLEHELREAYANMQHIKKFSTEQSSSERQTQHDKSMYESMKLALHAGKLDKYEEFLERIQYIARNQLAEYFGEEETMDDITVKLIQHQKSIAEKVRTEAS